MTDIHMKTKPASTVDELSIADGTFVNEEGPAVDLEDLEGGLPSQDPHPTPEHILNMADQGHQEILESEASPTYVIPKSNAKRNVLIAIAAGLLLLVALLIAGRNGGSTATMQDSSTQVAGTADDTDESDSNVEDVTDEGGDDVPTAEVTVPVAGPVPDLTDLKDTMKPDLDPGIYDAEKCAAPKTQRAWLECTSAAFASMRADQKRLEARVKELEARPTTVLVPVPTWMKVFTIITLLSMILATTLAIREYVSMKRKRSDDNAAP